jgi:hypothetical protein
LRFASVNISPCLDIVSHLSFSSVRFCYSRRTLSPAFAFTEFCSQFPNFSREEAETLGYQSQATISSTGGSLGGDVLVKMKCVAYLTDSRENQPLCSTPLPSSLFSRSQPTKQVRSTKVFGIISRLEFKIVQSPLHCDCLQLTSQNYLTMTRYATRIEVRSRHIPADTLLK